MFVPYTLTYVGVRCAIRRGQIYFKENLGWGGGMFKIMLRIKANSIYVTHTLTIHPTYAGLATHTLNTIRVRYTYVVRTLLTRYSYACKGLWAIAGFLNLKS